MRPTSSSSSPTSSVRSSTTSPRSPAPRTFCPPGREPRSACSPAAAPRPRTSSGRLTAVGSCGSITPHRYSRARKSRTQGKASRVSDPTAVKPDDRLALRGLRAHAFHGVLEHERRDGQEFVVDVELGLYTRHAAESDDLSATVHYGELAERLYAALAGDPVDLIETLAQRL